MEILYDNQPIAFRREFFRRFVANRMSNMSDKRFATKHGLKTTKRKRREFTWMNEERMVIERGTNWTTEKLIDVESNKPGCFLKRGEGRWTSEYKVYEDKTQLS